MYDAAADDDDDDDSILGIFYIFRIARFHHQEDHLYKQFLWYFFMHTKHTKKMVVTVEGN